MKSLQDFITESGGQSIYVVVGYIYDGDNNAQVFGTFKSKDDAEDLGKQTIQKYAQEWNLTDGVSKDGLSVSDSDHCAIIKI